MLLADGPFPASVIESTVVGRPLVVLNGCASAEPASPRAAGWEGQLAGVVHAFLFAGAVGAVGTLADVRDEHAAALARAFYRHVFDERPIGDALTCARRDCRVDPETASSPTWLSFALYGNPALTVLREPRTVARGRDGAMSRRTFVVSGIAAAAITATVGGVLLSRGRRQPPAPAVIGVMAVQVRAGDVPDWMRTFTRHALNTGLKE